MPQLLNVLQDPEKALSEIYAQKLRGDVLLHSVSVQHQMEASGSHTIEITSTFSRSVSASHFRGFEAHTDPMRIERDSDKFAVTSRINSSVFETGDPAHILAHIVDQTLYELMQKKVIGPADFHGAPAVPAHQDRGALITGNLPNLAEARAAEDQKVVERRERRRLASLSRAAKWQGDKTPETVRLDEPEAQMDPAEEARREEAKVASKLELERADQIQKAEQCIAPLRELTREMSLEWGKAAEADFDNAQARVEAELLGGSVPDGASPWIVAKQRALEARALLDGLIKQADARILNESILMFEVDIDEEDVPKNVGLELDTTPAFLEDVPKEEEEDDSQLNLAQGVATLINTSR